MERIIKSIIFIFIVLFSVIACNDKREVTVTEKFRYPNFCESVFENFITRDGDRLMDGNEEFRFAGANMPGMNLPYDYTMRLPERLILPTPWEQADGFETLVQMNAKVVRLWNLPMRGPDDDWMDWAYIQEPGKFNEEAFKTIDNLLALANQYGIRIIFSLGAESGDYLGGIGEYAEWNGLPRSEFYTNEKCKSDYKMTLDYVINRRNSVTGRLYKDDKAILAWQFGNELVRAPLEWEAEMADYLKSIDSNHLVIAGNTNRVPEEPPANLDIVTRHYYGGDWQERCKNDMAIAKGKRPFIIGEYGLTSDVEATRKFYEEALQNGTSGHLIWSMYFHNRFGGFNWHQIFTHPSIGSFHWPGFESGAAHNEKEMLALLREYAFKMQGKEPTEIPVPQSPQLLPSTTGLPFLTWRGSAGAGGYNIERAENPNGPWIMIGENVSDANVAYRPLFNDESALANHDYYYRVSALNSSGISSPSNILGPVRFRSQLFVDEFQNLDKIKQKSDGIEYDNDFNGLYGEYLFRLKGKNEEAIIYELPGNVSSIKVWSFFEDDIRTPMILVSSADDNFTSLQVSRVKEQNLVSFDKVSQLRGLKRVLVVHKADVIQDINNVRFVKIQWDGLMELDRVEIEFSK
jgi:mannan endo-1,4-beta-mannosidase